MKAFLKKTIIFLVPLAIFFSAMEPLLRNIPNDYSYKNNYLMNNSNKISKLFLGSSHTYYGINPDFISGNSFNGSHISQSINLDYEILKKYKNNWEALEYLMIPIDYFTLFSRMRNGVEYWRVKNYNLYYDIQLSSKLSENSELLSINLKSNIKRVVSYYLLNKTPITCSKLGYGNIYVKSKDLAETGKTAAIRHTTKDFSKLNETIKILEEIIDWASINNTKIIFYTTPAYTTYVSNLDADQLELTINTINKLVEKNTNCSYFNLLEDSDFYASDFSDADHLNQEGAKKLSMKLNELIITQ
ncbi:hypothetical protein [Eudoraea adriatica]|uniref:hypothetical protein n=1 Tax=Eudoraea adriatica TaxID=446681 RepID=UPI000370AFEC|nr:hypothetical protein [Eudoraea adriatica]